MVGQRRRDFLTRYCSEESTAFACLAVNANFRFGQPLCQCLSRFEIRCRLVKRSLFFFFQRAQILRSRFNRQFAR
jgi:hypothetical protein